jgi:hypothetical protein
MPYLFPSFLLSFCLLIISHSVDLRVVVIGNLGPFSSKGNIVQFRLGANDHSTLTGKLEIGASGTQVDLSDKLASGVPDVYSVSTSRINVTLGIAVYTIWESNVDKCECLATSP